MKPARFSYAAPARLPDALDILAGEEDARVIAGGQSLVPMMNMRLAQPAWLVDINGIAGLAGVREENGHLVIGAMTRHADLAASAVARRHAPILAHAAGTIGHYAIRQRGTMGGSLAHADPAAQLPLVCVLLDAEIEATSLRGSRWIAAADFFETVFTTMLAPDEMITSIRVPVCAAGEGWGFRVFNRRAGDFAEVSVAAMLGRKENGPHLRLALGAVAAVPVRVDDLASSIESDDDAWPVRAAVEVAKGAVIEDSTRLPSDYRRDLLQALVEDALRDAARRR